MKTVLSFFMALIIGSLLGFFGVFVSVFADGSTSERLITISIILLIYGLLGLVLGYVNPDLYRKLAIITGLPGELILFLYSINEMSILPYSLGYIILILGFSFLGAYLGRTFKTRTKTK